MGCLSCKERADLLKKSGKLIIQGRFQEVYDPAKEFAKTVQRDARSSLAKAADLARSRLSRNDR